jgi:putative Ca2+/H+ antiporter (TMEM165/GDT1 family)
MLQESLSMSSTHMSEEMREVEEELEHDSSRHDTQNPRGSAIPLEDVEEGHAGIKVRDGGPSPIRPRSTSPLPGPRAASPKISLSFPLSGSVKPRKQWHEDAREGVRNIIQLLTSPVFAQAFVLTFLGEWGDRSQITTIAMGGAHVSRLSF